MRACCLRWRVLIGSGSAGQTIKHNSVAGRVCSTCWGYLVSKLVECHDILQHADRFVEGACRLQNGVAVPSSQDAASSDSAYKPADQSRHPTAVQAHTATDAARARQLTVFVVGREAVLLQEVVLQEARRLQRDLVRLGQRVLRETWT